MSSNKLLSRGLDSPSFNVSVLSSFLFSDFSLKCLSFLTRSSFDAFLSLSIRFLSVSEGFLSLDDLRSLDATLSFEGFLSLEDFLSRDRGLELLFLGLRLLGLLVCFLGLLRLFGLRVRFRGLLLRFRGLLLFLSGL